MDPALKPAARAEARARRDRVAEQGAAAPQAAALVHLAAALVPFRDLPLAGYLPIGSEIDPLPVMAGWEGELSLPVILQKGAPLGFQSWRPGEKLIPGSLGTRSPAAGRPAEPRLLIVPLLAFDDRLYRLGYGGGFYDRTLEQLRRRRPILAIGFAFEAQHAAALPRDNFDQPLDMIVTETGIRRA